MPVRLMSPGAAVVGLAAKLLHLGGLGLIALGILGSMVPIPGGLEAATLILAAHDRGGWWYYALMATIGAVAGGYVTYSFGQKGGKAALAAYRKASHKSVLLGWVGGFERFGFRTISIAALLPPPLPLMPFLVAAGALGYPRKKFLLALSLGRIVRYVVVALIGALYGHAAATYLHHYEEPALIWGSLAVAVLLAVPFYIHHRRHRP